MENQNSAQPTSEIQNQTTPPAAVNSETKSKFSIPKPAFLGIVFVALLVIVAGAYLLGKNSSNKDTTATPTLTPAQDMTGSENLTPGKPKTTTPSEDPTTAGWQTYTNSLYGYTIKYPSNVVFKQDRFYLAGDDNRKDTADGFGPNLAIYLRSGNSPREAAQKELGNKIELKDVKINNYAGVQVVNSSLGFDYYISFSDGKILRIIFSTQDYSSTVSKESIASMESIAIQMVSTLKFTQ